MVFGGSSARADFEAPAAGSPVNWKVSDPNDPQHSLVIMQGSGCHWNGKQDDVNQDAWAIANGADLSVVFSSFYLDLPGIPAGTVAGDHSLSGRKNCSIRIPVEIARGYYIGELTQTLTVGATKSDDVDIDGVARTTFFGLPVTQAHVHAAPGVGTAFNSAQLTATVKDKFLVTSNAFFCPASGVGLNGIYTSNLAVSGVRTSDKDNLLVGIDALDVRWDVLLAITQCPLRNP